MNQNQWKSNQQTPSAARCDNWPPPTSRPMPRHSPSNGYLGKTRHTVLLLSMTLYGMEYFFAPLRSAVRGGVAWETEKALVLCKHSSAVINTPVCYQHCFGHKSKTQHPTDCYEKKIMPPKPDPVQKVKHPIFIQTTNPLSGKKSEMNYEYLKLIKYQSLNS